MASKCRAGQYWDALLRDCMHCHMECKKANVMPKCTTYCESTQCKTLSGHYYDGLLRKCMVCKDVCGRHPAECQHYCPIIAGNTTSAALDSRVLIGLEDSSLLIYPLLALSLVLLLLSLSLALVVFLMTFRNQAASSKSKEVDLSQQCAVKLCRDVAQPDFAVSSHHPTSYLSDDSSPTETCVCVHCFPDLKALSQGHDRPPRASFHPSSYSVLHKALVQNGGSLQTEVAIPASEGDAQQESLVG